MIALPSGGGAGEDLCALFGCGAEHARAGKGRPSLTDAQQLLQLCAVEPHNGFTIHQRHRRGHVAELFQFGQCGWVGGNVAVTELDAVL